MKQVDTTKLMGYIKVHKLSTIGFQLLPSGGDEEELETHVIESKMKTQKYQSEDFNALTF